MILKTEAIVLKTFDFRETSKIAVFFSRDYGKVKGVMKGIRKDSRKFGSSVDKFSVNDIVYYSHRNSDLHLISQCDLKEFFFPVRKDIKRSLAAQYILDLVDAMMPVEQQNQEVYQLMLDSLKSLEDIVDVNKLVHIFQIKILNYSGFKPHLDSCLICDKKILSKVRFSARLGGLICSQCQDNDASASSISPGTVASLLHIERNPWQGCLRLGLTAPVQKELKYILNNFLVFHLERQLKTARFVQ